MSMSEIEWAKKRETEERREREAWYTVHCPFAVFSCEKCHKYVSCKMKEHKMADHG